MNCIICKKDCEASERELNLVSTFDDFCDIFSLDVFRYAEHFHWACPFCKNCLYKLRKLVGAISHVKILESKIQQLKGEIINEMLANVFELTSDDANPSLAHLHDKREAERIRSVNIIRSQICRDLGLFGTDLRESDQMDFVPSDIVKTEMDCTDTELDDENSSSFINNDQYISSDENTEKTSEVSENAFHGEIDEPFDGDLLKSETESRRSMEDEINPRSYESTFTESFDHNGEDDVETEEKHIEPFQGDFETWDEQREDANESENESNKESKYHPELEYNNNDDEEMNHDDDPINQEPQHPSFSSYHKIYSCDMCRNNFASSMDLKSHEIQVHGKTFKYACEFCPYVTHSSKRMRKHMPSHSSPSSTVSNVSKYECPQPNCEKKYKSSENLKIHMRLHTGERPFKCESCDKTFRSASQRKIHETLHKPMTIQCHFCDLTFRHRKYLRAHMKTHQAPRQTPICYH